jgi:predicted DNA-binding transcriptional regulator YafY
VRSLRLTEEPIVRPDDFDLAEAWATGPDGRIEVELRARSELTVARQLAGFGDSIEVVEPESVGRHLADIGRGLLHAHA